MEILRSLRTHWSWLLGSSSISLSPATVSRGAHLRFLKILVSLIPLAILFVLGAQAAGQNGEKPSLRVGALPKQSVKLDGVLSEPAWATADSITNLVTIEPDEGGVPAGQTIVKVLGNSKEIIIGAVCHDPDPARIVSFSKARDAELDNEDHLTIVLDTFQDGRTGYVFAVNPSGARFDALVSPQGGEVNSDWDAVWEAGTSRDNGGWSAEIRIPIQSLRFKRGLSSWGLNVQRRVQRLQETSRWSGIKRDYEISQTSQAGILADLPNFDLGLGLSIRPAFTARSEETAGQNRDFGSDLSLDVTQRLGPNILTSLTVNTDFAETEVDARQTNLTRFEILFPEKRTFFLEGADVFEFGIGLDEAVVPFFSRRIGLFSEADGGEGVEIPIAVGGKLNGQVGNTSLGALVVRTRNVDHLGVPGATMGVVRVKQNIFAESSVGMIATVGDQLGRPGSWLAGADFTYRNSRFLGDKNLQIGVWGLRNGRKGLEGNKSAYGFEIDFPNDLWDIILSSKRIGDGFGPSLGFVPRSGVHTWDGAVEFNPRPNWSFVRQMFHEISFSLVDDLDFNLESYALEIKPVDWLLESGDRFQFGVVREGDRPREDFDVFASANRAVSIPAGSYAWTRYILRGALAEKRKISGEVAWVSGGFYGGNLKTIEAKLVLNWPLFKVELAGERNTGKLPDGEFTQNLYSSRVEFRFSPDLQVSSLMQYDNESSSLGTNTRLRWTFRPLGDLFVVYNHNMLRSVGDRRRWELESNKLVVKFLYAFRF